MNTYVSFILRFLIIIFCVHRLNKRNKKREEALNLLNSHKIYASSTFLVIKLYYMKSFDGSNTSFQLDHCISNSLSIVKNTKVIEFGVHSDHSAIMSVLNFLTKR